MTVLFHRRSCTIVLAALIVFAFGVVATQIYAQTSSLPLNQVGLPDNGTFQAGTIDSIQLNNGNLHVDIPLLHLPGIGMDTDIHFIYDNQVWTQQQVSNGEETSFWVYPSRGISLVIDPLSQVSMTETAQEQSWTCTTTGESPYVNSLTFTDGDGTNHTFGFQGYPPKYLPPCGGAELGTSGYSEDSSGYLATLNLYGSVMSIKDKHGRTYSYNSSTSQSFNALTTSIEDTNGNRITSLGRTTNGSGAKVYQFVDTADRTITETTGTNLGGNCVSGPAGCTTISYKDESGNPQTITINNSSSTINYPAICSNNGQAGNCSQYDLVDYPASVETAYFPTSIVFQNGDEYTISYNSAGYGEISSITLPTGGEINYTYNNWLGTGRQVTSRSTIVNGVTSNWTYTYVAAPTTGLEPFLGSTTVTDPLGNNTVYTCTDYVPAPLSGFSGFGPAPCYMTNEQIYSGAVSPANLAATKTIGYTVTGVIMPTKETFNWQATNQTTETDTQWDSEPNGNANLSFGNVVSKTEYDYGSGSHGSTLKNTQYTYLNSQNSAYTNANMLDRVSQISVYNGSSSLVSSTTIAYDNYSGTNTAIASTAGTTQHDYAGYSSSITLRGLPTGVTQYTGSKTPSITTYIDYNDLGNKTASIDGRGNTTSYSYGAQNAFVSSTVLPPTPGFQHIIGTTYDVNTGLLLQSTDQNGTTNLTNYTYDSRMRPLTVTFPDGGSTTNTYPDPNHINTTTAETGSTSIVSSVTLDGLGRTTNQSTVTRDACGSSNVDTTYDLLGRVNTVSNPHCSSMTLSADGITTYSYDELGRNSSTLNPNGTTQGWSYNGNSTTAIDENGNQHTTVADALGRLTKVLEPNGSSPGPSMETDYTYDALNDLLSVTQWGGASGSSGARIRGFSYDGLSRLLSATNSETGTVNYTYDGDSNVATRADARSVTTTYQYDALNRTLSKSYSGDPSNSLSSCYQYDSVPAGIGWLSNAWTQSGACSSTPTGFWTLESINGYDPIGRVSGENQYTPSNRSTGSPYAMSYTYDYVGDVLNSTNGTTKTPTVSTLLLTSSFDAAGRLQSVTSNWSDPTHPISLFALPLNPTVSCSGSSTLPYAPFGGLMNATFGTSLNLNRSYNNRLQTTCEFDTED